MSKAPGIRVWEGPGGRGGTKGRPSGPSGVAGVLASAPAVRGRGLRIVRARAGPMASVPDGVEDEPCAASRSGGEDGKREEERGRRRQSVLRGSRAARDSPASFDPRARKVSGAQRRCRRASISRPDFLLGPEESYQGRASYAPFFRPPTGADRPARTRPWGWYPPTRAIALDEGQVARVLDGARGPDLALDIAPGRPRG